MDLEKIWNKALKHTEIIRSRIQSLMTFSDTHVPYILLSESSINLGDTVVRKGEVLVQKPSLILPPNIPQFDGFDFKEGEHALDDDSVINFLLIRGIHLPSLKYNNTTHALDIYEDKLSEAVKYYRDALQQQENINTGLLTAPEDCWQFSVLIFICSQIARNVHSDIQKLLDEYKRKKFS